MADCGCPKSTAVCLWEVIIATGEGDSPQQSGSMQQGPGEEKNTTQTKIPQHNLHSCTESPKKTSNLPVWKCKMPSSEIKVFEGGEGIIKPALMVTAGCQEGQNLSQSRPLNDPDQQPGSHRTRCVMPAPTAKGGSNCLDHASIQESISCSFQDVGNSTQL